MHELLALGMTLMLVAIGLAIIYWWIEHEHGARMTLRSIKKVYNINPERWTFFENSVWFEADEFHETITFNLIEFYKYKLWRYMVQRKKDKAEAEKSRQRILSAIKADIDKIINSVGEPNNE